MRSKHNKDQDIADLWTSVMTQRAGLTFEQVVGRMRSDRAAKGVAGALDMDEEEVCEMHDTDKLGKSALGGLVRTKMKVEINPFLAGTTLVQRAHKLGTHFGYGNRHEDLMAVGKDLGDCPTIKIKVDYNTTRIAAVHGLLYSELRLCRALKAYDLKYSPGWTFGSGTNTNDWQVAAEFEAVLNCTRITSTLAQVEKKYMAAYTLLIKQMALNKLKAPLEVVNLSKVTASPKLKRESMSHDLLTTEGETARVRALLEGERRWCGNKDEVVQNLPILTHCNNMRLLMRLIIDHTHIIAL